MNPDQSGIKPLGEPETFEAASDFTGKRSYLAVLGNDGGKPVLSLPGAITDDALFQVDEEGEVGDDIDAKPLVNGESRRFKLKGTCNPGDDLCLADPATPADAGKVRKVPATAGTYRVFLKAQEVGVDGQLVKARVFIGLKSTTVAP